MVHTHKNNPWLCSFKKSWFFLCNYKINICSIQEIGHLHRSIKEEIKNCLDLTIREKVLLTFWVYLNVYSPLCACMCVCVLNNGLVHIINQSKTVFAWAANGNLSFQLKWFSFILFRVRLWNLLDYVKEPNSPLQDMQTPSSKLPEKFPALCFHILSVAISKSPPY